MTSKKKRKMIEELKEPLQNYLGRVEQSHKKGLFVCENCPIICCDCIHGERPMSETVYFPNGRFDDQPKNETSSFRVCREFADKHIDPDGTIHYHPDPEQLKNHIVILRD